MTEFTPTTDEVFEATLYTWVGWKAVYAAEDAAREGFDRWLDKVKSEAQVQALRMAADDITLSWSRGMVTALATECHKKQCRCGNPAPEELARQIALSYRDQIRNEAEIIAREAGIETGEAND